MIDGRWLRKDLEGSGRGLFETTPALAYRGEEEYDRVVRLAGVSAGIRTEYCIDHVRVQVLLCLPSWHM
jgi:hypothetical protein